MSVVSWDVCFFPGEDGVKRVRVLSGGEKVTLSSFQDDDFRCQHPDSG